MPRAVLSILPTENGSDCCSTDSRAIRVYSDTYLIKYSVVTAVVRTRHTYGYDRSRCCCQEELIGLSTHQTAAAQLLLL